MREDKYYPFTDPRAIETQEEPDGPTCVFNDGVTCKLTDKKCGTCGWNPAVAIARHKAMGIYQSVADLPTDCNHVGKVLYVYESKKIYAYRWDGYGWALKMSEPEE